MAIANPITLNGYRSDGIRRKPRCDSLSRGLELHRAHHSRGNASLNPTGGTVTVSGNITGVSNSSSVRPTGTTGGTLTLSGAANTYSGGTLIAGAVTAGGVARAFGTGNVTLQNFAASALTESVANALNRGATR